MLRPFLAFLLAAFGAISSARAEGVVFPNGASVGLAPPPSLQPAQGFSGFQDKQANASIVIVEMPAEAYKQIIARMTKDALAGQGFVVEGEPADWPVAGGQGRILRGTQTAHGLRLSKWVLIAGTPSLTALITAQVPQAARASIPDTAIEAALRTVTMRAPAGVGDQMAALPFKIGDLAGLRPVRTIAGSGIYLTDGPKDVVKDGSQALVIVAASLGAVPPTEERTAFARQALSRLTQVKDVKIADESQEVAGPVEWTHHEAEARDASSQSPMRLVQVMRFEGEGYVRVIGLAREADKTLVERTRRLATSISLR